MKLFDGNVELKSDREFAIKGIHTIWVKTANQDIRFLHGTEDVLRVKEYLHNDTEIVHAEQRGDSLCFQYPPEKNMVKMKFGFGIHIEMQSIVFYIPASFKGQIYAESMAGDIEMEGVWQLANLQMKAASGDIELGSIEAEHFLIETQSGDIDIEKAQGDRQVYSASGDIVVKDGIGNTIAKALSGDMEIRNIAGAAELNCTSGDIEAEFIAFTGDSSVHATSGDIDIRMNPVISCKIMAKAVAGDVSMHMPDMQILEQKDNKITAVTADGGEHLLTVSATSGDIQLYN